MCSSEVTSQRLSRRQDLDVIGLTIGGTFWLSLFANTFATGNFAQACLRRSRCSSSGRNGARRSEQMPAVINQHSPTTRPQLDHKLGERFRVSVTVELSGGGCLSSVSAYFLV